MHDTASFVGGVNVPAVFWRVVASIPLGHLTISDSRLTLRPGFLYTDFSVGVENIAFAFPTTMGVGFQLSDGATAYFSTLTKREQVLRAVGIRGVRIDPSFQAAASSRWWGPTSTVATLPRYAEPFNSLMPFALVASVAMMVWFWILMREEPLLVRVLAMAFCVSIEVFTAIPWWNNRTRPTPPA